MNVFKAVWGELETIISQGKSLVCSPLEKKKSPFNLNQPTVLLIHGLMAGNFSTRKLAKYLEQRSYNAVQISYPQFKGLRLTELEEIENGIINELEHLCHELGGCYEGSSNISVVGHSLGGLLAYGVAQRCSAYIKKVIGLGAPFNGIKYGKIIGLEQIAVEGSYILMLQSRPIPQNVQFISLRGSHDLIVSAENARLPERYPHVKNVEMKGVGHWKSVECFEIVYRHLKE